MSGGKTLILFCRMTVSWASSSWGESVVHDLPVSWELGSLVRFTSVRISQNQARRNGTKVMPKTDADDIDEIRLKMTAYHD